MGVWPVVFVGSIMGDCEPGPGCHDHDGLHILNGFAWTVAIAASVGVASWLVSGVLRMAVRPLIGSVSTTVVLISLTLVIVWFSFSPATELMIKVMAATEN